MYANGCLQRITPAYAGKSLCSPSVIRNCADHPRLCGEKLQKIISWIKYRGSPPPMRGKVLDGYKDNPYYRITPAYAGKRIDACNASNVQQDHPRLCGEKARSVNQRYDF